MQRAFSLVELSIVLVILGLLVGGVLSGQSLIRAAEIRSVSSDTSKYQSAIFTFRDKYFALPGDMNNAGQFWGLADSGTNNACAAASSAASKAVCNGNGDGLIGPALVAAQSYERFQAWKQLANAGLIEGTYSGAGVVKMDIGEQPGLGVNVPSSRISNVAFGIYTLPASVTGNAAWFDGNYGNMFCVGGLYANNTCNKAFKPEEAWNVDTKLDDGKPGTGKVRTAPSTNGITPNCADSNVAASANYKLSTTSNECPLQVLIGV